MLAKSFTYSRDLLFRNSTGSDAQERDTKTISRSHSILSQRDIPIRLSALIFAIIRLADLLVYLLWVASFDLRPLGRSFWVKQRSNPWNVVTHRTCVAALPVAEKEAMSPQFLPSLVSFLVVSFPWPFGSEQFYPLQSACAPFWHLQVAFRSWRWVWAHV